MLRLDRRRLLIPLPGDRSVSPAEVRADGRGGANIRRPARDSLQRCTAIASDYGRLACG